ncbi:uncharacterized protein YbjT (DUF2867 family) [Pseudarthrobacter oxydans]|nr:uncharacterized protein YbjT (DUF2867 family) [Pseudarthrobacter oxydans]
MPAGQLVAAGRDLAKVADLAGRGVQVRQIDYQDPASLRRAFAGAGKVLLISDSEVGQRLEQHRNAIEAAGKPVTYRDLPVKEYAELLVGAGLPAGYAAILADSDRGIAHGELLVTSGDLSRLIGRLTTSLREAVRAATVQ